MRSTRDVADPFQRGVHGPEMGSCLTAGMYNMLERMTRTHGRSPASSFNLFSLLSDVLGLLILIFLARRGGKRLLNDTAGHSPLSASIIRYRDAGNKPDSLH